MFFLLLIPFLAFGFSSPPLQLPYGGAGAASLKNDFSYLINPALLGFQTKSQLLLAYSMEGRDQRGLVAMQDRKGVLPLGISYVRFWKHKGGVENKWSVSVGQSLGDFLSIGVNIHKDHLKPPWNADVGLVFKPAAKTALGLVFGNLTVSKNTNREKVLTLGAYQEYGGFFSIRADASRLRKQGWLFKGGFETLFYNFFALRMGGLWIKRKKEGILSGGAGFYGPRLHLEYGAQKGETLLSHVIAAKLIF